MQKGDTLWGICDTYFHDPWRWPKVWALNPDVTNPHWIFPGQTIRIGGITQSAPGSDRQAPAPARRGGIRGRAALRLRPPAPARQRRAPRGRLRRHGRAGLRRHDQRIARREDHAGQRRPGLCRVRQGQAAAARASATPSIRSTPTHPVKDPEAGKVLGYLVRIFGDVTIEARHRSHDRDRHAARPGGAGRARLPGRPAVPPVQDHQAAPERERRARRASSRPCSRTC